jgi:hypothetical protein
LIFVVAYDISLCYVLIYWIACDLSSNKRFQVSEVSLRSIIDHELKSLNRFCYNKAQVKFNIRIGVCVCVRKYTDIYLLKSYTHEEAWNAEIMMKIEPQSLWFSPLLNTSPRQKVDRQLLLMRGEQ